MKITALVVAMACLVALPATGVRAADRPGVGAVTATQEARAVDQLFAPWAKPHSPGAAIAVIRDGKIVYSRGYGEANLEYGVPNTPDTVFHLASVSKQFTAFAIYLLAQEGKLSLDDDVRKYVPQLHDFGKVVTIRELLHHTSGVRDQWNLLALAGWRLDDEITDDDVARLLFQQTALNFPPGDKFLYSNSGYSLLALVVKQVSGQPLSAFAKQRIFDPLGMTHTHFQDSYSLVVPNRAYSYARGPDGQYRYVALTYSTTGPSSLFSTVGDLARWDQNFYDGKVGGLALLARMQEKGKLNSGAEIPYASGLEIGTYRGLRTVSHSGGDAAYGTFILRFPDQHFSVVVLGNAGLNPGIPAYKIADIYLKDSLKPAPPSPPPLDDKPEIKVDAKRLDAYVGDYEVAPGFFISFTRDNDHLVLRATGQQSAPMYAVSDTAFRLRAPPVEVVFDSPSAGGRIDGAVVRQNGVDRRMKRTVLAKPAADQLKAYEGRYYSAELGVIYDVRVRDGALEVRHPRGDIRLEPEGKTTFVGTFPIGQVTFACGEAGACNGFTINNGRVENLKFEKVAVTPVGR
ncbi:serine hydrolase [Phenylobacterium sp.]|jgi:CubicO group peptidase (beta-lactamase class C family)|uniref:serine hydrolase n=1 Tax=Phenylobacterium sp. TaxID=1871053 RepID=UPI002F42C416